MDINEKILLIADGKFEIIAKLSADETTELCRLVRGLRGSLDWVTQERDALNAQLETTKRELMATDISWQNALAELEMARGQDPEMPMHVFALSDEDIEIAMHGKELPMDYDELKRYAREIERAVLAKAIPIPKQDDVPLFYGNTITGDATVRINGVGEFICKSAHSDAIPKQEPAVKILSGIKDQQQNAWLAVCKVLDEVKPDWLTHGKKGVDCAVYAIRSLSESAQAAAMPEYLSAIEVLRENIRHPDRGVEYCGIFDNDKTRAAIGTLLSASQKP